jgi:hypothetical protein
VGWGDEFLKLFRDTGVVQLIAFIMSIASLVISTLAWRSSHRTSYRLIEIEEERDKREIKQASKARLTGTMYRMADHDEITIRNYGEVEARNIKVWLDDKPAAEHPAGENVQSERERISAQASLTFLFYPDSEALSPGKICIEWEDNSGEKGLFESDL